MKRLLLNLFAVLAVSASGYAFDLPTSKSCPWTQDVKLERTAKAAANAAAAMPSRSDDGYMLRYCADEPYTWVGYGIDEVEYKIFIYVPADVATQLAGNELSRIYFSAALKDGNTTVDGTVFVCEGLEEDGSLLPPVTESPVTIRDSYTNQTMSYQIGKLQEPYIIKEGQEFMFGFSMVSSAQDAPIAVDGESAGMFAGYYQLTYQGESVLLSAAQQIGSNLFLYARTTGPNSEVNNLFAMGYCMMGAFTLPVYESDDNTSVAAWYIENYGNNPLTSIKYTYQINDGEIYTNTAAINLDAQSKGFVAMPIDNLEYGRNNVLIMADEVNNQPTEAYGEAELILMPEGEGYARKFVVEEGTGTWCGWCPRGIVGMEYMTENYPDDFIGIAVHVNDAMQTDTYQPLIDKIFGALPYCIANRDPFYADDPNWQYLEEMYTAWEDQSSPVKVDMDIYVNDDKTSAKVTTNTCFAIDDATHTYKLAYVVLENGLIAAQTNNYAGMASDLYGQKWCGYKQKQIWTYEHTARGIYDCMGLDGSIPATIEKGKVYTYEYDLDLSAVKSLPESSVVVLVLDETSGTILNAKKVTYDEMAGIGSVIAGNGMCKAKGGEGRIEIEGNYQRATVYSANGAQVGRMDDLQPGLYLVNVDGKSHKVVVK